MGEAAGTPTPKDAVIRTFHQENVRILQLVAQSRDAVAAAKALPDGTTSVDVAERLSSNIDLFVSVFFHYKRKELLILPHLETHAKESLIEDAINQDNRVRTSVAMGRSLMSGAWARPTTGNLQSVAWQLEDACDYAESIVAEEESELVPQMRAQLDPGDWQHIAALGDGVLGEVLPEKAPTWGPGALDVAEARLRTRILPGAGA